MPCRSLSELSLDLATFLIMSAVSSWSHVLQHVMVSHHGESSCGMGGHLDDMCPPPPTHTHTQRKYTSPGILYPAHRPTHHPMHHPTLSDSVLLGYTTLTMSPNCLQACRLVLADSEAYSAELAAQLRDRETRLVMALGGLEQVGGEGGHS